MFVKIVFSSKLTPFTVQPWCANEHNCLGHRLAHEPQESEGAPKYIIFTLNTYKGTIIGDTL